MQLFFNIALSCCLYLLIANSFSVIYYTTKFFHLAHAGIIAYGAYLFFLFSNKFSWPFPISIVLAVTSSTLIGILCELLVYRPMRKRNVQPFQYLIASIGLYVVFQNCISLYFGDDTQIIVKGQVMVGNKILGAYITNIQILTILISITLFIAINLFLGWTVTGKFIRAVSNNPELSNIYGIRSDKIILITFGIGSALASIAGILYAMNANMTPTLGFNLLLYGIVAMIIGGVGSSKGLITGAFLLAASQNLAAFYIDTKWIDAVAYTILILFLLWKPLGFSGQSLKKVEV